MTSIIPYHLNVIIYLGLFLKDFQWEPKGLALSVTG